MTYKERQALINRLSANWRLALQQGKRHQAQLIEKQIRVLLIANGKVALK